MLALRYKLSNTSDNVHTLAEIIRDENCKQVILFGTTGNDLEAEIWDQNLPLVAALAIYEIPNIETIYVLFDGIFLTAARPPRFMEVQRLLDVAQESNRVYFCESRAPLTRTLNPEEAVNLLKDLGPTKRLTSDSRAQYFSLLCGLTEQQYIDTFPK